MGRRLSRWPLAELVLPDRLAVVVATADHNPGRLIRLLAVPAVRKALTDPQRTLPADLDRYTQSRLLQDAFAALSDDQRDTLATLALHGPTTHRALLPDIIDQQRLDQAFATGWITRNGDQITFASRTIWSVANHQDQLTDDQENQTLDQLAAAITDARATGAWADFDPGLAESLLTALLAGQGAADMSPQHLAELTRLRRLTGRHAANTELTAHITHRLTDPSPQPTWLSRLPKCCGTPEISNTRLTFYEASTTGW